MSLRLPKRLASCLPAATATPLPIQLATCSHSSERPWSGNNRPGRKAGTCFSMDASVWIHRAWLLTIMLAFAGCRMPAERGPEMRIQNLPQRDINLVLRDHAQELLAIPDVVGVFVGLL